jgi:hypothetical protein
MLSSRIDKLFVSLEAFVATEFNENFTGRQHRHDVKVFGRSSKQFCHHLQGVSGGLLESKHFPFCQTTSNTLKIGTVLFPETSENIYILMQLSDRENNRCPLVFGE